MKSAFIRTGNASLSGVLDDCIKATVRYFKNSFTVRNCAMFARRCVVNTRTFSTTKFDLVSFAEPWEADLRLYPLFRMVASRTQSTFSSASFSQRLHCRRNPRSPVGGHQPRCLSWEPLAESCGFGTLFTTGPG